MQKREAYKLFNIYECGSFYLFLKIPVNDLWFLL